MAIDQTRERLVEELTQPLLGLGLDLEAVELTPAGRRRVLRVAVDKDGGVTMDDVADATKEISRLVDASDVMGEHPYTLEVTSPGIDRPLEPASPLAPQRRPPGEGHQQRRHDGRRVGSCRRDEESATLDVDGTTRDVRFDAVTKAHVQIEFNRPSGAGREEG